ncbi:hypothetical protein [Aliidiomarina iranensis]|uniref:hypothetical protein n=1 Tax=Aliidiomarina iranensis TaxID=1434071 RepID=UPI000F85BD5D|nr:hypothetical protein [Aliidiomarina iranensis]
MKVNVATRILFIASSFAILASGSASAACPNGGDTSSSVVLTHKPDEHIPTEIEFTLGIASFRVDQKIRCFYQEQYGLDAGGYHYNANECTTASVPAKSELSCRLDQQEINDAALLVYSSPTGSYSIGYIF